MNLSAAKKELLSAERALNKMKATKDFEIFEEEWRDFLNCLEKVWIKSERACQSIRNKFQPWQGKYSSLRRKDKLLSYLKQARDADNHSVQEVAQKVPGGMGFRPLNQGAYIKEMHINAGKITHYEGDPIVVTHHAETIEAVRVKNNGSWYNVPSMHLGKRIESSHPISLAELGFEFYSDYLKSIELKFGSNK